MTTDTGPASRYHHGNLREALLAAGEAELAARGVERFSMRGVAKRAGVSHGAPAHHFRDVDELLTALAAVSFARFLATMERHATAAGADAVDRLVASGTGYIAYATGHPAMFDLQFFSDRPDRGDPALSAAAQAAYRHLSTHVEAVLAKKGRALAESPEAIPSIWATTHGLATLFGRRAAGPFAARTPAGRGAAFERILRAAVDAL